MLVSDDPATASSVSGSLDKQKTKSKLTEDDKKKLNAFFSTALAYQCSLYSIYNKYSSSSYNTIDTYGRYDTYRNRRFSTEPSKKRSQALTDLKKLNLEEDYTKLR
ncbi:hypothetical protein QIA01_04940 (plasmid) [Borreliella americana]